MHAKTVAKAHRSIKLLPVLLLIVISFLPFPKAQASVQPPNYVFERSWGGEGDQLYQPFSLAVSPDGSRFYAINRGQQVLSILNRADLTSISVNDFGAGTILYPTITAVAVGTEAVYAINYGDNLVEKFSLDGKLLTSWGGSGSQDGQLKGPFGIAVDPAGYVYVADTGNDRIQKFSGDGVFMRSWGGPGSGEGQFENPVGIAADSNGGISVLDSKNNRIQKFSSDGIYLSQTDGKVLAGWVQFPRWLAVDRSGNIFVSGTVNCQVLELAPDGTRLANWSQKNPNNPPSMPCLGGLAIDDSGTVYVADGANDRIVSLLPGGSLQTAWNPPVWEYSGAGGMAVDSQNNVYVTGRSHVLKFSADGSFLRQWGGYGSADGQFTASSAIAIDHKDIVYAADPSVDRIEKFKSDGTFISKFGSRGTGPGQFEFPHLLAVDAADNLFVIDEARVQKYSPAGKFLAQFGSFGNGPGQFSNPVGLAIDPGGNLYVSDSTTAISRIIKFSPGGQFLTEWGNQGSGDELLSHPTGIVVDPNGFVLVADSDNNCIKIFSPDGVYLGKFGRTGSGPGELISPQQLTIDKKGSLYVGGSAYRNGYYYQKFIPGLPAPDPLSGVVRNGTFEADPALSGWTVGGRLPVSRASHAVQCRYSALLGKATDPTPQGVSDAWAHTTVFVPAEWSHPELGFQYDVVTNDTQANASFFVEVQDVFGQNHLATLLAAGAPGSGGQVPPGDDLGWQSARFDLSAYKGQYIRLVFSVKNLQAGSLGVWAYIDGVTIRDAAASIAFPTGKLNFLPMISHNC